MISRVRKVLDVVHGNSKLSAFHVSMADGLYADYDIFPQLFALVNINHLPDQTHVWQQTVPIWSFCCTMSYWNLMWEFKV
jgi:hypothetical protein